MRRFILLSCFFLSFFLGCKDNISIEPPVEIPEEKDNKTYLEIKNQSQFDVNIYVMLPHSSESPDLPWLTVPKGETKKQEISPSKSNAGDYIYIEYEYVVENVVIHCYDYNSNDCNKQVPIYENKVNTIEISANPALNTDDSYVIIQNETSDEVFLFNEVTLNNNKSTTLICPINSKGNRWIDKYGVYKNLPTSGEIYLGNDFIKSNELNLGEIEPGNIYVYRYNDETVSLLSATPFNFSLQNKVWKNSLSKTYGKDLVAGCIATRENPEDGYMLFGSLSASYINDNIEGNVSYYAFINTEGNLTKEYSLTFRDSPKSTVFYHCIEKNGIWLAVGKNRYEDNSESLFVVGEQNGRTFYQKIPSLSENSEQEQSDEKTITSNYKACGITYVENNTFCVLLGYEDDENEDKVGGFGLLEITIDGSNNIKTEIVYETSAEDENKEVIPCSVLYNNGKYIVLSQNSSLEDSTISVIEKNTSDEFECSNDILNSFSLNKMKIYSIKETPITPNDNSTSENIPVEYLFLSGSYVDEISGRDIATFGKISIDDINSLSEYIDTSNFKVFTGSNNSLNSNFYDFVVDKKGNIILGGFSCGDYNYTNRENALSTEATENAVPFVVSYDLNQNKTNWEKEYTEQKGYVVYSVDKSSIDSLFLDLWNPSTRYSYIVSTGLLGEIPEKLKLTLPHSSSIEEVEGDDIIVKFYENANSQTAYVQTVFKLGKEYTFEDLKKYEPGDVCKVTGWYILDKYGSNVNRNLSVFSTTMTPIFNNVVTSLVVGTQSVPNSKDEDDTNENDSVVEGEELTFPVKFTDYNITEINLYPKYECSIHYDENYHWNVCTCGKKVENKSEHSFSNWQNLNGKDIKKCSSCDFTIIADENTHVIYSVYDLQNIKSNNTTSAIFELANDIDGGGNTWVPIDTFFGTLVGNGFSIKNFTISEESELDNETAYCGFFYKNRGTIKNIFFKNITVDAYFEYFTDDWRKVNVGTVIGLNSGTIKNVHMENIQISSVLNHQKDKEKTPHQLNVVGGIVGVNKGIISYCSIKNSEISASTSAKKNRCDTSSYAGGICGDVQNVIDNVLVVATIVSTHSEGGFIAGLDFITGDDLKAGILRSYAGNIFGTVNCNNVLKVVSYNNSDAIATTYNIHSDPTSYKNSDKIAGINKEKITSKYSFQASDLKSYSSTINSWDGWSVYNNSVENYLDFD